MATITAEAITTRIEKPKMRHEAVYEELWRRLGMFERLLPNIEAKTDFDGELWDLAKRIAEGM